MKVLHLVSGLGVGGAESQLCALLRHTGHDADVVTLHDSAAPAMISDVATVHSVRMRTGADLVAIRRLLRRIREGGYDVIHTHRYQASIWGRRLARLAGTRVVVETVHSSAEIAPRLGVRTLFRGCDVVIPVSDTVRQRLIDHGYRRRKLTAIPNGLDFSELAFDPLARSRLRLELGIAKNAMVIGVLGRLSLVKRYDLLIAAAAPLLGPDVKVLVAGDGQQRPRLQRLARAYGVDEHVIFAGQRADVADVLSAMDLFVLSSATESFGVSVLEALGNGLPVLYTTCPALAGIAAEQARQVPGEVEAMRRELHAELDAGRPRAAVPPELPERYGIEEVAERVDELYERLWTRRVGRAATVNSGRSPDLSRSGAESG